MFARSSRTPLMSNSLVSPTSQQPWTEPVQVELERVEATLRSAVESSVPRLLEASTNLLEAGGKRLRPCVTLLWAKACGADGDAERMIPVAAATELIHMATLMHDDVIDRSDLRRGRRTANAFWGNKVSVLTGDYVLCRAFDLLVQHGSIEILRILAGVTMAMTESEALQAASEGSVEEWRENYWRIISGKTAGFIQACCEAGAVFAEAEPNHRRAAASYGADLGLAFQITDDLLDLIGRPTATGKRVGSDLKDGKVTLPVLLTLDGCSEEARTDLAELISSRELTDADMERIRALAQATGAVDETRVVAARHSAAAADALTSLPDTPARSGLRELAKQVVERTG